MTERWEEIAEVIKQLLNHNKRHIGQGRIQHHSCTEAKMGVNCSQHGLGHTLSADTSAKRFKKPSWRYYYFFILPTYKLCNKIINIYQILYILGHYCIVLTRKVSAQTISVIWKMLKIHEAMAVEVHRALHHQPVEQSGYSCS